MGKEFKVGDRVRVNNSFSVGKYLQKDNRVGTVISVTSIGSHFLLYWLHMDKSVKREDNEWIRPRPSIIPQGYAYFALPEFLELLESVKPQKPFDIWSIEPPKVEREPRDESIPNVWKNEVLV